MDNGNNVQLHGMICKELTDLYERKNHDYGDSFHQTFIEEGFAMSRIRLSDKLNRFKSLTFGATDQMVKDESIRDTLIDLANYAIMTIMEIDRSKKEPSEPLPKYNNLAVAKDTTSMGLSAILCDGKPNYPY